MLPLVLFVSATSATLPNSFLSPIEPHPAALSPALVETQKEPFDIEKVHPKLRPCHITVAGGECGETPTDALHPDGLFCPPEAPLCVLTFGVPPRYICSTTGFDLKKTDYSEGNCSCKSYGEKCPDDSTCIETEKGPYCECSQGYMANAEGDCVVNPTSPPPAEQSTVMANTVSTDMVKCNRDDCTPGFCKVKHGKIVCTCVSGYVAQQVDDVRQQCVFVFG